MQDNVKELPIKINKGLFKTYKNESPFEALCQIIYNSLDASATNIDIYISYDNLSFPSSIKVIDNGIGIEKLNPDDEKDSFLTIGYSNKKPGDKNKLGRLMHGKAGQGRFKSFALGTEVVWKTKNHLNECFSITGIENKTSFIYKELNENSLNIKCGTIFEVSKGIEELKLKNFPNEKELEKKLKVIYLTVLEDNKINISLNGKRLIIDDLIADTKIYTLKDQYNDVNVKSIIWKEESEGNNRIFWCDDSSNILYEEKLNYKEKKTNNTIYISSNRIEEKKDNGYIKLFEFDKELSDIKNIVLDLHENFLDEYKKEKYGIIKLLKHEGIYPYSNILTKSEEVSKKLYDKIITKINEKKPNIFKANKNVKKYILNSLKELLETEPECFEKIIKNLLNLNKDEILEFSKMLNETSLSNIIKMSRKVIDRINFLNTLRHIVYERNPKMLKERSQLHKILEKYTWIFGEEYNLSFSDKSFRTIVEKIRNEVKDFVSEDQNGENKIPDLFFTKKSFIGNSIHALIVELKRPSVKIGRNEINQIKDYFDIIVENTQFKNWKIDLIVISSELKIEAIRELKDEKIGLISYNENRDPNKKIYIKTWSDIIDINQSSLEQLRNELDLNLGEEESEEYIKNNLSDIINN